MNHRPAVVQNLFTLLHHELKKLRSVIGALRPEKQKGSHAVPCCGVMQDETEAECERIRESLTGALFSNVQEEVLERFIRYHQTGLIELADELQSCLSDYGKQNPALGEVIERSMTRLLALLDYIERFFSKYFNPDEKIPQAYGLLAAKETGGAIGRLTQCLGEKIGPGALKDCILDYLLPHSGAAFPPKLTFRGLAYLKGFIGSLENLFRSGEDGPWEGRLSMVLISLNFNHLGFFAYCQDSVRQELEHAGSAEEYKGVLAQFRSLVRSGQTEPGFCYHPLWPGIREMLERWLDEELLASVAPASPERNEAVGREEKMALNLSVAQIAMLARLFYDEGCYGNASVTDVIKFIAGHYSSKRQQQISPGSLAKEYYGTEQTTAAIILDLLQKMTGKISRNFFPALVGWVLLFAFR